MTYSVITGFKTTLAQGMTSSQLTMELSSMTVQGHAIVTADYGGTLFITINPGAANQEVVRVTSNSSTSLVIDKRGLVPYGESDATDSGLQEDHNAGEPVVISNVKNVYDMLVDKISDETIEGVKTFSSSPIVPATPTTATQATSKSYVDLVAALASGTTDLLVEKEGTDPTLLVIVNAGELIVGDEVITYAGSTGNAVTAADVNYVQLRFDGTLDINITGFAEGYIPLAEVTADATTITAVDDKRPFFTLGQENQLVDATYTYGDTIAVGNVLYSDTADAKLKLADGSAEATADGTLFVALEAGVDDDTGKRVQIGGLVTGLTGLTAGWQYLSDTAGELSNTTGTYRRIVGWAPNTTTMILVNAISADELTGGNPNSLIKFGGDGSDGALDTSGGVVNIDLGNAEYFEKNYSSINIATNDLTFTNPATKGTLVNIRCSGAATISADIIANFGGVGAVGGAGGGDGGEAGSDGTDGSDSDEVLDTVTHFGAGGEKGQTNNGGSANNSTAATYTQTGVGRLYPIESEDMYRRFLHIVPGAGGGGAGGGAAGNNAGDDGDGGAGGAGGIGGGALIIEVAGDINFTGTIDASGTDGSVGVAGQAGQAVNTAGGGGGGGGGGGAGGYVIVFYNTQTAVSGTIDVTSGAGGAGGNWGQKNASPTSATGGGGGEGGSAGASVRSTGGAGSIGGDGNGSTGATGNSGGISVAESTNGIDGSALQGSTANGDGGAGGAGASGGGGEALILQNKWFV